MDRCTKFKVFNLALLFCLVNFFIYRFFAFPASSPFVLSWQNQGQDADRLKALPTGDHQHFQFVSGTDKKDTDAVPATNNGLLPTLTQRHGDGDVDKTVDPADAATKRQPPGDAEPKGGEDSGTGKEEEDGGNVKANNGNPEPSGTETDTGTGTGAGTGAGTTQQLPVTPVQKADLPLCPLVPPNLSGPLATYSVGPDFAEIASGNRGLRPGGKFKPADCQARHRVAVVIPYRNRQQHLRVLLHNLHPMLRRQQLDYGIYVIDQELPTRFNRAMLMNIGYVEAMKDYDYQCVIFHDVDLIPENDHNLYSCPKMPRHLSAAIDKFKYRLPYAGIYGGVSAMTKEHMQLVNGFSNMFFGWGGEDDDMSARIRSKGLKISRYPMEIARYRMIKHVGEKGNEVNPQRHNLLKSTVKRMPNDGLNSLKYTVKDTTLYPTHTQILVYIDENDYKT